MTSLAAITVILTLCSFQVKGKVFQHGRCFNGNESATVIHNDKPYDILSCSIKCGKGDFVAATVKIDQSQCWCERACECWRFDYDFRTSMDTTRPDFCVQDVELNVCKIENDASTEAECTKNNFTQSLFVYDTHCEATQFKPIVVNGFANGTCMSLSGIPNSDYISVRCNKTYAVV